MVFNATKYLQQGQMSGHLDSAIRQVTKQMNVREIWMGAVKEMKKKDSRQTHNDNKSDCTDGEAEYETESIIKHNENIRSKNKRCN